MPRVAADRPAAEPASPEQKERHRRILRTAARHGAAHGFDRVQMHDVARDAGVAIATLYRYFPSKVHLFTALMRSRVEQMAAQPIEPGPGAAAADGIGRLLVRAGRDLLETPLLAQAMLQANNATVAHSPEDGVGAAFRELMLRAGGIAEPTAYDQRLLRLLEQAWYGLVISALNRHTTAAELEADTVLACRLLLRDREGETD
ncbi:TetR family transcriptional regulator [Nocardioides ferulae]|uniref:TetR family transcriptional regulator n=1 Tax=Nocardioides ferulae TaxID=2340821 RepID=UPI000EAF470B|nr:TetR family transcriptional regulator [Nocardioides ferulae]